MLVSLQVREVSDGRSDGKDQRDKDMEMRVLTFLDCCEEARARAQEMRLRNSALMARAQKSGKTRWK